MPRPDFPPRNILRPAGTAAAMVDIAGSGYAVFSHSRAALPDRDQPPDGKGYGQNRRKQRNVLSHLVLPSF
jgi:hypothetical protein